MVQIVAALEQQGIAFESSTERIETSSAEGNLVDCGVSYTTIYKHCGSMQPSEMIEGK